MCVRLEICVDDVVQEELVLNAWVALVTLEQVHNCGDLDHEVRVNFAFPADTEEIVLCHECECLNVRDTGRNRTCPCTVCVCTLTRR